MYYALKYNVVSNSYGVTFVTVTDAGILASIATKIFQWAKAPNFFEPK